MSHEPGRERYMIHKCENCGCNAQEGELIHVFSEGEYWCEGCLQNEAEAAYERQHERNLESPPESAREDMGIFEDYMGLQFNEGQQACADKKSIIDNPYDQKSEIGKAWIDGFNDWGGKNDAYNL